MVKFLSIEHLEGRIHMKNMLERYKIQVIGAGLFVTIVTSSFLIGTELSKDHSPKKKVNAYSISDNKNKTEENKVEKEELLTLDTTAGEEQGNSVNSMDESKEKDAIKNREKDSKQEEMKTPVEKEQKKEKEASKAENHKAPSASNKGDKYTVKDGDSLFLIAEKANVSVEHLKEINNLSSDVIYENQILSVEGSANNATNQVVNRGNERNDDLYWLSRIIHAEAQGESYEGKVAVGNVIMNRVKSSLFPNTIKGVVFDKQNGYTQFSPVLDGSIYNSPDSDSINAATAVLNGERPVGDALYFLNPRKSTNFWIVQNRKHMKTIGLHDFYY